MTTQDGIHDAQLACLAELGVKVGLNLQEGQDLVLSAPVTALPLVRAVARAAYAAGAGLVTPILSDEAVTLARYRAARDASFDRAPDWLFRGMAEAYDAGAARMAIVGDDPMLLADEDPDHVARAGRAQSRAGRPALERIANFAVNWNILAYPGPGWAARLFPDLPAGQAQARLAQAIMSASRATGDDPVADWQAHNAMLHTRRDWLNAQRFDALHFRGPGTELTVGLAEGHLWQGGAATARNGVVCNPNIPTEEVFTTPHAARTEGHVRATKPLAHQGSLIEGIEMRFEGGRIVQATATRGEAVLHELIDTDDGARRLGEVALVPHASPIAQSGLLFLNTLFDENAACHIALGQCYSKCFEGGEGLDADAIAARGGNASLIHVDWMIGNAETEIDGIRADGTRVPVFRAGNWAD